MAKKKRKDENELLDEILWCVKYREGWRPDGRWCWDRDSEDNTRRGSIVEFYYNMHKDEAWWTAKRKKGVVACVKVKLVEQP